MLAESLFDIFPNFFGGPREMCALGRSAAMSGCFTQGPSAYSLRRPRSVRLHLVLDLVLVGKLEE